MSELHRPGVAILASGGGTTAEAFIRATQEPGFNAEVSLVVCSKPREEAGIWNLVDSLNTEYGLDIPVMHISHKTHPAAPGAKPERGQTDAESEQIYKEVQASGARLVLLAGYMRIVRGALVEELGWHPEYTSVFQAAMINTHPGPLPETADTYGEGTSQRVLDLGMTASRHTVHLVAPGVDTGPIIKETSVPVKEGDTAETLFKRVQFTEKAELPKIVDRFLFDQEAYDVRTRSSR